MRQLSGGIRSWGGGGGGWGGGGGGVEEVQQMAVQTDELCALIRLPPSSPSLVKCRGVLGQGTAAELLLTNPRRAGGRARLTLSSRSCSTFYPNTFPCI